MMLVTDLMASAEVARVRAGEPFARILRAVEALRADLDAAEEIERWEDDGGTVA